jgi:hypothetical protein
LFNKLLELSPSDHLNLKIAKNIFYLDRRINRTEAAYRFSHLSDAKILMNYAREWFYDKDTCIHAFGNHHKIFRRDIYGLRQLYATRGDSHVINL